MPDNEERWGRWGRRSEMDDGKFYWMGRGGSEEVDMRFSFRRR